MWTVLYKKELSGFFYNRSAYFIMFVYLVLSLLAAFFFGLYFVADNPAMRSYFAFQPQILAVVIPAVTMRVWSEEAKNGTLEVLLTFPVSDAALVTAKFAAAFTLAALMLSFSLPLAFSTAAIVPVDGLNIAAAYLGTFLAAAALTALGCTVSAAVPLPAASYLISVLLGWALVGLNFSPLVSALSSHLPNPPFYLADALNFSSRYQSFLNGCFGIDGVLYFMSLTGMLLIFNGMAVTEKRRER